MNERNKLFVGNLSFHTNEDDLVKYFSKFGKVAKVVIWEKPLAAKNDKQGNAECVIVMLGNEQKKYGEFIAKKNKFLVLFTK